MRSIVMSTAFLLAGALSATAAEVLVPGPEDTASGALHALETWQLGGIGGNWLAVGQPNTLNRDDRAVVRFAVAMYLRVGKVAKATLRLVVNPQTRGESAHAGRPVSGEKRCLFAAW